MQIDAVAHASSNHIQGIGIDVGQGIPTSTFFDGDEGKNTLKCDGKSQSIPSGDGGVEK